MERVDDWKELVNVCVGWGNDNGNLYTEFYSSLCDVEFETKRVEVVVRKLGYRVVDMKTRRKGTERKIFTNVPYSLFEKINMIINRH
jgi:hypothetical protein